MTENQISEPNKIREFTDLKVWQEAHKLVLLIYAETKKFPREEIFGIISQMRRAAVSISSNIAEGFGRKNYKEKVQFYCLSLGSLYELENQVIISRDTEYLPLQSFENLWGQLMIVQRLLNGFISKTKSFL